MLVQIIGNRVSSIYHVFLFCFLFFGFVFAFFALSPRFRRRRVSRRLLGPNSGDDPNRSGAGDDGGGARGDAGVVERRQQLEGVAGPDLLRPCRPVRARRNRRSGEESHLSLLEGAVCCFLRKLRFFFGFVMGRKSWNWDGVIVDFMFVGCAGGYDGV